MNQKICLSASAYHPEMWQASWGSEDMVLLYELIIPSSPSFPLPLPLPLLSLSPSLSPPPPPPVRTMLLALIGFMPTDGRGTIGSLECTSEARRQMAQRYLFLSLSLSLSLSCLCIMLAGH